MTRIGTGRGYRARRATAAYRTGVDLQAQPLRTVQAALAGVDVFLWTNGSLSIDYHSGDLDLWIEGESSVVDLLATVRAARRDDLR